MKALSQYIKEHMHPGQNCFIAIYGDIDSKDFWNKIETAIEKNGYSDLFDLDKDIEELRIVGYVRDFHNARELFHALNVLYDDLEKILPKGSEVSAPTFAYEDDDEFIEHVTHTSDALSMAVYFKPEEISEDTLSKNLRKVINGNSYKLAIEFDDIDDDTKLARIYGRTKDFGESEHIYYAFMKLTSEIESAPWRRASMEICDPCWDDE